MCVAHFLPAISCPRFLHIRIFVPFHYFEVSVRWGLQRGAHQCVSFSNLSNIFTNYSLRRTQYVRTPGTWPRPTKWGYNFWDSPFGHICAQKRSPHEILFIDRIGTQSVLKHEAFSTLSKAFYPSFASSRRILKFGPTLKNHYFSPLNLQPKCSHVPHVLTYLLQTIILKIFEFKKKNWMFLIP